MYTHEHYMLRALELAQRAEGYTYPNPLVGCVIVHQGRIIGEGYHRKAGENHAEIEAINSCREPHLLKESVFYVTLEPCAHYGKTPPCALRLKEIGPKMVVVGSYDSNPLVAGKGTALLRQAGVEVIEGVLEKKCRELNRRFFCFHEKKRPYVVLKWAESKDGYIDKNFQPAKITTALESQWVHTMRAQEEAILVGTGTALSDNPSLTTRLVEGPNPLRLLIDRTLKVPETHRIYSSEAPTWVFNLIKEQTRGSTEYIKLSENNIEEQILKVLYQRGIQSVLVEGGAYTLQRLLDLGLYDQIVRFKNQSLELENGTLAPRVPPGLDFKKEWMEESVRMEYQRV